MPVPPLVTTSPVGTGPDVAGVIGEPGTTLLLGDRGLDSGVHSGGRVTLGWWLDPSQCEGIEASYLGIGRRTSRFRASSDDTPILARPVFDTEGGAQAAMLVSYPDLLRGSIAVDASSELQSAEVLWRSRVYAACGRRMDVLFGYRFARLDESLRVGQSTEWIGTQGQIIPGTTKDLFDLFNTHSQFHGGELGIAYHQRFGPCWSLEVLAKLALGNTHSEVLIDGATLTTVPDAGSATFVGGLLAQETNIGRYTRNDFAVVPEVGITLVRDLTCRLRATFGYNFVYWSKVARPGEQIDVGVSQFPPESPTGELRPSFQSTSSGYWAQGLRFGLDYRF
jgi:hypothetical protein